MIIKYISIGLLEIFTSKNQFRQKLSKNQKILNNRPAARWLGERNADFKNTHEVTTSHAFRAPIPIKVPVLMIHGNMDKNTPLARL